MPDLHQLLLQRRMAAMGQSLPRPADIGNAGALREDGSQKGHGFLGDFPVTGGSMSEYSIADPSSGIKGDYPSIVPTLNAPELNQILNDPHHVPESAADKALAFALSRQKAGQSVFAQDGEQRQDVMPYFRRVP